MAAHKGAEPRTYHVETWGCQMNVYDSGRLASQLEARGYEEAGDSSAADVILLNTCSVREKAAHKVYSRLGELSIRKRANPELIVGVAGCVAQQEQERLLKGSKTVDLVVGPRAVGSLPRLLDEVAAGERAVDVAQSRDSYDEIRPVTPGKPARAYVTVVEGCNKACSFCIVPTTRGPEVSRPPDAIVAEAQAAVAGGALEVELLGQNVNAYQHGEIDFAGLLRMVDRVAGLHRLRFTTSHPRELTDRVIDAMAELPSVCDHLHLPVQSGSDSVLKRMYRGYDRARYLSRIRRLRERVPTMALSTDMIVGFPEETDAEFEDTMRLVDEIEFDQVFAFHYSPRPFTRAAELEDSVPLEVKRARLQRLLSRQDSIARRKNAAMVGAEVEVLVGGPSKSDPALLTGRTTSNRIVHFPRPEGPPPVLASIRLERALAHSLVGVETR